MCDRFISEMVYYSLFCLFVFGFVCLFTEQLQMLGCRKEDARRPHIHTHTHSVRRAVAIENITTTLLANPRTGALATHIGWGGVDNTVAPHHDEAGFKRCLSLCVY